MKHISLSGLDVSRIGLGAMSMSGYYNVGQGSDAESIRTIHRALDLGVTLLDTAEIYGPTPTRNWSDMPSRAAAPRLWWRRSSATSRTPAAVLASWTVARRTSAPRSTAPLSGSAPTTSTCTTSTGSTRTRPSRTPSARWPTSSRGHDPPRTRRPPRDRRADRVLPVDPRRGGGDPAAAAPAEHRLRALFAARPRFPYRPDPLHRRHRRRRLAQDQPALHRRKLPAQPAHRRRGRGAVAAAADATPAQTALAWRLAQGDDIAPIPGTKRVARIEENTATDAIELSAEQIERLNNLTSAAGERHKEGAMAAIER